MRGIYGLIGVIIPALALAQSPVPPTDPIQARMQKFVDAGDIAGAVTVAGNAKGVTHHAAVGYASLEGKKKRMERGTLFRIASMTKPITAMGIMILADRGKLSVDDPVEKHLPEFKGQMLVTAKANDKWTLEKPPRPITIRDLLTHTSGLPGNYGPGLADIYTKRNRTLAETTLALSQRPLEFAPGTRWSYCNPGIDTLGRIIEVLSGQKYETFLAENIFDPLGMENTTFYLSESQAERLAVVYNKLDGKLVPSEQLILDHVPGGRHPIPAGGLFSTGEDLAKLYRALLNKTRIGEKRILSEKSLAEMTRTQTGQLKTGFVEGMSFGYGFAVVVEPRGVTEMLSPGSYGHGGAFGTQGWIDPKQDLFFVLLFQRTGLANGDASEIRREFQRLVVEQK